MWLRRSFVVLVSTAMLSISAILYFSVPWPTTGAQGAAWLNEVERSKSPLAAKGGHIIAQGTRAEEDFDFYIDQGMGNFSLDVLLKGARRDWMTVFLLTTALIGEEALQEEPQGDWPVSPLGYVVFAGRREIELLRT